MNLLQDHSDLRHILSPHEEIALTIGNFDGVHLGHRDILTKLQALAAPNARRIVAMTFDPHPMEFFHMDKPFERVFSMEDQEEQLRANGVQILIRQRFDLEFSKISAEKFLQDVLLSHRVKAFAVGHDFRFGAHRRGDRQLISDFCRQEKIHFQSLDAVKSLDGNIISSTRIRQLLKSCQVESAALCLGRQFYIEGSVVEGRKLASTLGVPTANLQMTSPFVPGSGVYLTKTQVAGETFSSVTNIGTAPTVESNQKLKIETHLLDFQKQIYGQKIKIHFIKFLREEKKFSGLPDLKNQIECDLDFARGYFRANS